MNLVFTHRNTVSLEGACNFRDLGGLVSIDGRTVRHGMIFRSDELSRLTDVDLRCLQSAALTTVVDLRIEREIDRSPDRTPESVRKTSVCSLDTPGLLMAIAKPGGSLMPEDTDAKISELTPERLRISVIELYEKMITEPDCVEVYKKIFALLLEVENTPLLFHCMAGKDRTGVVAALILAALGVDEKAILDDYLVSNVVVEKKYAERIAHMPSLRFLFEARSEYLSAALATIRKEHGSIDRYLRETIGVDIDGMKNIYLE